MFLVVQLDVAHIRPHGEKSKHYSTTQPGKAVAWNFTESHWAIREHYCQPPQTKLAAAHWLELQFNYKLVWIWCGPLIQCDSHQTERRPPEELKSWGRLWKGTVPPWCRRVLDFWPLLNIVDSSISSSSADTNLLSVLEHCLWDKCGFSHKNVCKGRTVWATNYYVIYMNS